MNCSRLALLFASGALAATAAAPASAQVVDSERIISGLSQPLFVTSPPGDERLFILEQNTALVKIYENGSVLATPYIDLKSAVTVTTGGERGLLGLAFHPNYSENGYVFVSFTGPSGRSRLDRFTVDSTNPYQVDNSTRVLLYAINQPFSNHNGGCIAFGPDGYLWVGTGDGGSANDPACRAQNPQELLGKMLRIDVDVIDATGGYGIPADNPYVGDSSTLDEIYFLGMRNPWRFSFDRKTGDLYIGDVGQNAREEIDFAPIKPDPLNMGWKVLEANNCNSSNNCPPSQPGCASPVYTPPIFDYNHSGGKCSITGGYVYRGHSIPALDGAYFYGDYCSSQTFTLEYDGTTVSNAVDRTNDIDPAVGNINLITSYGQDTDGELYIVDPGQGEVYKVLPEGGGTLPAPALDFQFDQLSISGGGIQSLRANAGVANAGKTYLFAGSASGTSPGLTIDGQNIPLNFDSYTNLVLGSVNSGPFKRTLGTLDSNGRADALIDVDAGTINPALAGLTLNHAYVVLELTGTVGFASNATSLTLIP